jgi:SsrA-binding protein
MLKVLLGVGRGKGKFDKRETIRKRDADRELRRATMHNMKGK